MIQCIHPVTRRISSTFHIQYLYSYTFHGRYINISFYIILSPHLHFFIWQMICPTWHFKWRKIKVTVDQLCLVVVLLLVLLCICCTSIGSSDVLLVLMRKLQTSNWSMLRSDRFILDGPTIESSSKHLHVWCNYSSSPSSFIGFHCEI